MEHDLFVDLPVSTDPVWDRVCFTDVNLDAATLNLLLEWLDHVLNDFCNCSFWHLVEVDHELVHVDLGVSHLGGDQEGKHAG